VNIYDYFTFGMGIKDREWSESSFGYRFGFNGYENEPDIAGQGSVIDFGARIYDSRLGRFFSTDPIVYPYWSPYQYDGNSPIALKDYLGMGNGDPDKPKKKEQYKDPNGSTFLADDIKRVAPAKESTVTTHSTKDPELKFTANVSKGSVLYFDTEDGTRYAARFTEVDGVNQFKGYFDKDDNKYDAEYTYGPIVMQTSISVETNKETGVQTAKMTIYGNEKNVWNNKTFSFVVPEVTALDPTSKSKSVSVDGTYSGQLFLKKTDQDVEKLLQNITISATSSSIGVGRNFASVGVRMNTLDGKRNYQTLFYGFSFGGEVGVGVGGLPLGPASAGTSSGVSVGDTARPMTFPTRSDTTRANNR
jgi:RHS repeat-associated protein